MKVITLLLLLLVSSLQQTLPLLKIIASSSLQNTEIVFQGSESGTIFFILDAINQGYINSNTKQVDSGKISSLKSAGLSQISAGVDGNAQWINSIITQSSSYYTIFNITFSNDCPKQNVVLNIYATGWFWAFRSFPRWQWIGSGPAQTIHTFKVPVFCGKNEILIYVWGARNAIKHWITQDQSNCYDCKNSITAFYSRETCQCECLNECKCRSPLDYYTYPICNCRCNLILNDKCVQPKYWNRQKCACVCPRIFCPKGYDPSQDTCSCKWSGLSVNSIQTDMPPK